MLTSMAMFDQSESVNAMKNTSGSMKRRMSVRVSGVMKVVDKATALKNHIDALMLAHMDLPSSGKKMLNSRARLDQSENARAMTNSSISIMKRMPARIAGVLKVVENATAMTEQIDALMVVPMDYSSITRMLLTSMGLSEKSEHVHAMKHISSLTKKRMPARTSTVLRVVEKATAIRNQIDALMVVHTDYTSSTKERLSLRTPIGQSEHACVMKHTSSLTKKRITARISGVLRLVDKATAIRKQIDALMDVPTTD